MRTTVIFKKLQKAAIVFLAAVMAIQTFAFADGIFSSSAKMAQPMYTKQPKINCTSQEISMLEFVVAMEANGGSYAHKKIIANIIINRVLSDRFPNTVSEVLHAKNQFTTIKNYYTAKVRPDAYTINAVYEALYDKGDYSNGALFFYNPKYSSVKNRRWFENSLTFLFEKEGHRFFS